MNTRTEHDSMGSMQVPSDALYGAQTQRSLHNFDISSETLPPEFIHAYALLKKAAAITNAKLGKLPENIMNLICQAADEVADGQWDDQFPLRIWQTGSGTQSNMNVNEVIANRAIQIAGGTLGSKTPVHPNDHVNMAQSTNDSFPTAMHMAACIALDKKLLPALRKLREDLDEKAQAFDSITKIGRTHLQDAVPIRLGQAFSAFVAQLDLALDAVQFAMQKTLQLALGGSAVGTGLNTHKDYARTVAETLAELTGLPFVSHPNKFMALAAHDEIVLLSSTLKTLAASLMKIANDIRWMASGPRCGLGELNLPANEPGSSIMPGKINPTQAEALTMICTQVMGNDTTITLAGSQGNFELNVYKPVMAHNILQSIRLLADGCTSFSTHCVHGITANKEKIDYFLHHSLMLVTALAPEIGYDKAAEIAHQAFHDGSTLKESCLKLGYLDEAGFDSLMKPESMTEPQ
jgi:fumarate hydratase, class II